MGKKSGPPAPDYTAAAEKTATANKENLTEQTWANRADQYNPWGSQTWGSQSVRDPATGQMVNKWTQTTQLDPRLQSALDSQIELQGGRSALAASLLPRAQQEFGQRLDYSGLTPWGQGPQAGNLSAITNPYGFSPQAGQLQTSLNFGGVQGVQGAQQNRMGAENAIYQSAASRLDPQWQQRASDMENQLANQGITKGSASYSRAMDDFSRQRNDAYQQAQMAAITGGGTEAQRNQAMDMALRQQQVGEIGQQGAFGNQAIAQQFGMGLQGGQFDLARQQQAFGQQQGAGAQNFQQGLQAAQFQNQMRQQQLAEMMQQRGASLNEINAIISGQQVNSPNFAGYNTAGLAQGPDYSGAARDQYGAAMDAANFRQAGQAQMMQGLGGMAMMFSDRRLKRDLERIGTHARGFGIYLYRFIGERGRRIGVIAQDVQRFAPELVRDMDGVLAVDYSAM